MADDLPVPIDRIDPHARLCVHLCAYFDAVSVDHRNGCRVRFGRGLDVDDLLVEWDRIRAVSDLTVVDAVEISVLDVDLAFLE